jgi:hypothetical protein
VTASGLRLGPSIAAAVLALAVGTLVVGACVSTQSLTGFVALGVGWWLFAAGCLFAANQAWVDRSRAERVRTMVVCLFIVGAPFLPFVLFVVAVNVWEALGGHL